MGYCEYVFKSPLYERRGIICRTFGLAAFDEVDGQRAVRLPECSKIGLNYSEIYDPESGYVDMEKYRQFTGAGLAAHPFDLKYMAQELTRGLSGIEFGEIRPMLDWFISK